jgi:hypothetical protein
MAQADRHAGFCGQTHRRAAIVLKTGPSPREHIFFVAKNLARTLL